MAKLRWVKGEEELRASAESDPEFLESTVRSVRCVYETDPALVEAVIPRPLKPTGRPEVCVTFSHVAMHISPEFTFEIGSTIFGVRALHDGTEGIHLLTMPMTAEQAVLSGRDTYGEPKKIAEIDFAQEGDRVRASTTRMGIPYLQVGARLGDAKGPREMVEHAFCFKAQPSCEPGGGFDQDPLLVRLEWRHAHREVRALEDVELVLTESPFDPVADLPIRRLLSAEYEVGTTQSNGRVLQSVPGEWVLPFLHGRYDEPGVQGIEVDV